VEALPAGRQAPKASNLGSIPGGDTIAKGFTNVSACPAG